jgi:hypothetical protein
MLKTCNILILKCFFLNFIICVDNYLLYDYKKSHEPNIDDKSSDTKIINSILIRNKSYVDCSIKKTKLLLIDYWYEHTTS